MKRAIRPNAAITFCAVSVFAFFTASSSASDRGMFAANQVSEANYRALLGDDKGTPGILYAHNGGDRGFGADHDLARANIVAEFQSYGLTVTLEPFTYSSVTYYNVVATKTGTLYPTREYIIGAHFDSVSNPGADDDGSGTALIMEAARVISQYDSENTIRFIAFDREEQGLIGSSAYVSAHSGDDIRGMVQADMVAYDPNTDVARVYNRTGSAAAAAMFTSISLYGDGLTSIDPGWNGQSDHASFDAGGFDACLLIEGEVWNNPHYHTQQDSVDTPGNINYAYAVKMTRSVVGYIVDEAGVLIFLRNGDVDGDGLVTLADYAVFADCLSGPGTAPTPTPPTLVSTCLGVFDFDADGDVDLYDAQLFTDRFGEGDCNGNGVADTTDVATGASNDCNTNSIPDECDIAAATSNDCNANATPDECELVGGYGNSVGQDTCTAAEPACPGFSYTGTTTGMTSDGSSSCGTSSNSEDVWYVYEPASSGSATIQLCNGTAYDAVLSVHTGCPGSTGNELNCDDDGCGSTGGPSTVTLSVTEGSAYWIRVTGWDGSDGAYTLQVSGPDCTPIVLDCNGNGIPDDCDIASGFSADTNSNGIPDECEGP